MLQSKQFRDCDCWSRRKNCNSNDDGFVLHPTVNAKSWLVGNWYIKMGALDSVYSSFDLVCPTSSYISRSWDLSHALSLSLPGIFERFKNNMMPLRWLTLAVPWSECWNSIKNFIWCHINEKCSAFSSPDIPVDGLHLWWCLKIPNSTFFSSMLLTDNILPPNCGKLNGRKAISPLVSWLLSKTHVLISKLSRQIFIHWWSTEVLSVHVASEPSIMQSISWKYRTMCL